MSANSSVRLQISGFARRHPGLLIALAVYFLLAFSYFFVMPIFEGPDEWTHTGHVKYIAQGNGLPVMLPGQGIWGGQQPPLYYGLGALLVQPFSLDGVDDYEENRRNPHAAIGFALDPGNKNNYLHSPDENFPYRDLSLTVHALRLYSMAWGALALVFIYFTAFEIYNLRFTIYDSGRKSRQVTPRPAASFDALEPHPHQKWFAGAAALFVACQPMYAFINASVANEPANIGMSAVVVYLSQRYVLRGPAERPWRALGLGAALGLASLAKMTGLSAGLVAVVAFLQTSIATRKTPGAARRLWRDGLLIGLMFLLVGGWWYLRNVQLYGDFFQQGLYKIYFNVDPQPLTLSQFIYTVRTGEVSFWATFGWLNVVAPDWVYSVYRIISRVGLLGAGAAVVVTAVRRRGLSILRHPLLLHLIFPAALAFSLTRLVATEGGLQGRQLLPALGSISIVVMWGWWALLPAKILRPALGVLFALLLGMAVWLPLGVAARAYTPSPLLAAADVPAGITRLDRTYNGQMKLLGVDIGVNAVHPGERVPVTAYWQVLNPMDTNYSVFVHLVGRGGQSAGQFNSYPSLGLRPTSTLKPGQIFADTYPVRAEGGSEAPTRLRVDIGLFDFDEAGRPGIPAVNPDGAEVPPAVGQLKLIPHTWPPPPPGPPLAEFADNIMLAQAGLQNCTPPADRCIMELVWAAQDRPSADYTVFVQVWQNGAQVAGFDAPPLGGDYPTGLWDAAEIITDPHPLDLSALPPGRYQILVGLYNFATGDRLPAAANGTPLPDFAVDLGNLDIN